MFNRKLGAMAVFVTLLGFSVNSHAIMINTWTHDSGSTPADYSLNVSQSMGLFNFSLNVVNMTNADLFGFYFNVNDSGSNYQPASVMNAMTNTGDGIAICGFDIANCGGTNNLNGEVAAVIPMWDLGLEIGVNGSASGSNTMLSFSLADAGLSLTDFESFGIRSQTTGSGNGSDKAYALVDTPPVDVPEPASMALMGLGLVGLGLTRRKRKLS